MDSFFSHAAARIKEERQRLGLSQKDMAQKCSVSRELWGKYERNQTVPGGDILLSLALAGGDVQYVLTGNRASTGPPAPGYMIREPAPPSDEQTELLMMWAALSDEQRTAAMAYLHDQVERNELKARIASLEKKTPEEEVSSKPQKVSRKRRV